MYNCYNIIIPTIFLGVTFAFKVFRNIPPKRSNIILHIIELPMDLMILDMGFLASYVIFNKNEKAVLFLLVGFLSLVLTFGFSQTSIAYYQKRSIKTAQVVVLSILSYSISIGFYIFYLVNFT
ncbi:MAG: hypothetical protein IJT79_01065 [Ruminococcus sp.]|nr:hypothetical protein [Ruminococcus sp.]